MNTLTLFDVDGTLTENSDIHSRAFSSAFERVYGVNTTIEVIEHHGMTDQEIMREVLRVSGLNDQTIESKFDSCMKALVESFAELVRCEEVIVLDGVRELLEELQRRSVLVGLVTGNLEPIARSKLKCSEINRYFRVGAFGSDGTKRADLVRLAVGRAHENFGFLLDGNAWLFGDTPKDMKAGKRGGVATVGVATGIYTTQQLTDAGADFVFQDLKDTGRVLEIILRK